MLSGINIHEQCSNHEETKYLRHVYWMSHAGSIKCAKNIFANIYKPET